MAADSLATYMQAPAGSQCPTSETVAEDTASLQKWYVAAGTGTLVILKKDSLIMLESSLDANTRRLKTSVVSSHAEAVLGAFGAAAPGVAGSVEKRMARDQAIALALQHEYCFYEARYEVALRRFLEQATATSAASAEVTTLLNLTKSLNQRLNALLEVANMLALMRVKSVNSHTEDVNKANTEIRERLQKMAKLETHTVVLTANDAVLVTQRELVRYTGEKNSYAANQVSVFVALNALALAALVYAHRYML